MKLQVLVIFVLFVRSSSAQDIECIYKDSLNAGTWYYTCELVIQNPNGFNNFTTIIGTHLPNRTDADVLRVHTHYQSKSTIFPQILCSQFKNLVQVHMNVLRLERINEESFRNCFNLQQLLLPYNYIENIHEQAFSRNTKLKVLNLNSNFITSLPDELFDNLVNLEELDISYNTLEIIPDGLFKGLKNLIFLNMEANNLKALNPVWFENVTNLEALIIARNNLTVISEQIFSKLKNLWGLDISRNAIGNNLAANAFKELRNLTFLYMESIQITQISNKLFESLKNLMELYMSGNLIDLIPEGTFDNLISLTSLDIGGCQLTEYNIPGNLFNKMSQLSYLNMNMNQIQTLNIQWFQNLFKLTSLGLNQNQINEIPIGIFSSISNLEGINLSNNYLKVISRNAFGNVSNLENVMFNGNLIRAIDEKFLKETNRLIYFSVLDNLCIDKFFYNFGIELEYNLPLLRECTSNFKLVVGELKIFCFIEKFIGTNVYYFIQKLILNKNKHSDFIQHQHLESSSVFTQIKKFGSH